MKGKQIVLAMGLAFGSSLAVAADTQAFAQRGNPDAFWSQESSGGYMTTDQAMKYQDKEGKSVDMKKLDSDKDDKISEAEWTKYHRVTLTRVAPGVVVVDPDTFWVKNAKDDHMTRDQAMQYKDRTGRAMDFERLDADKDGRASKPEWTQYHTSNPLRSDGARGHGTDDRGSAGAGGPAGRSGSSSSGSSSSDSADGAVKQDYDPTTNPKYKSERGKPFKDSDPTSGGRGAN